MKLPVEKFIKRFLLHVLPKGFKRVRHCGYLANHSKKLLSRCRELLNLIPDLPAITKKSTQELMLQLTGRRYYSVPSVQNRNVGLSGQIARVQTRSSGVGLFVIGIPLPTSRPPSTARCRSQRTPASSFANLCPDDASRGGSVGHFKAAFLLKSPRLPHHPSPCTSVTGNSRRYNPHRQP